MSPKSLRRDMHRIILRGVRTLHAIQHADYGETPLDILEARDAIKAAWSYEERERRWLVARLGILKDHAEYANERRRASARRHDARRRTRRSRYFLRSTVEHSDLQLPYEFPRVACVG